MFARAVNCLSSLLAQLPRHQHLKFLTSATHAAEAAAVAVVAETVRVEADQAVAQVAVATTAALARVVGLTARPAKSAHALASSKVNPPNYKALQNPVGLVFEPPGGVCFLETFGR
jgi:hypothetical protein